MGSGGADATGNDPGIIADVAEAVVKSFLTKRLLPKFQADYDTALKELKAGAK
jgi:hypothetical protein